ncbi:MAG: sulfatase [Planctomycetota bacterium]
MSKPTYRRTFACFLRLLGLMGLLGQLVATSHSDERPNVLFIAVDDLRSQLGCYGDEQMVTPNIDTLASQGILFRNHYVSNPICIPSRAAMLTSLRSERTQQVYGPAKWIDVAGVQTMGRTFGDAGYFTASLGKIWHVSGPVPDDKQDRFDIVWKDQSDSIYAEPRLSALRAGLSYGDKAGVKTLKAQLPAAEDPLDVPDEAYNDGLIAEACVRLLRQSAASNRPFLIMAGFKKPHLPFNAPKKYWDLYDPANPPGTPALETLPKNASKSEIRANHELWKYAEGFSKRKPPHGLAAARLRQAYAACVSFVDAQIGKVLTELDHLGLTERTVIVLWSDHGYQLGHLGSWTKLTNFEMTAGSPLIISAPGFREGGISRKCVESVDLFPTLLDLCGLPTLAVTDGVSLRPLLANPNPSDWHRPAFHLVKRGGSGGVGRAVRDERFRYIEWRQGWNENSKLIEVELYDYQQHAEERVNVADDPNYASDRERLASLLWTWR